MHQNEVILMSNGFDMVNRILREFVQPPLMNALYISQLLQQMLAGYPNVIYIKASQLPGRLLVHVQCDLYQARCCALTAGRSEITQRQPLISSVTIKGALKINQPTNLHANLHEKSMFYSKQGNAHKHG